MSGRLVLGAEAREFGRGGVTLVARACRGVAGHGRNGPAGFGVRGGSDGPGAPARRGGGRKPLTATDPGLLAALEAMVDPDTRGDPMSALRWTSKSTRTLAAELTARGHPCILYTSDAAGE